MMKTAKQISLKIFFTMILVLTIALFISITAVSRDKNDRRAETEYYRAMEQEYVRQVRGFLQEKGYANSGVTMTEVVDEEGNRAYTVTIHHGKIKTLSEAERQMLLAGCGELQFADADKHISHKFLEADF